MKRASLSEFTDTLRAKQLFVFTKLDLTRLFGWSDISVTFLLHRYTRRGVVQHLRKGLYQLTGIPVSEFYLANRLHEPSYVSLETALSFHRIIPETVYVVTSMTTVAGRAHEVNGVRYEYHRIKLAAYGQYEPHDFDGLVAMIACAEKAFVDHCYLVTKGLKTPLDPDRLRLDRLDRARVAKYAAMFNNYRLNVLLNKYLDNLVAIAHPVAVCRLPGQTFQITT